MNDKPKKNQEPTNALRAYAILYGIWREERGPGYTLTQYEADLVNATAKEGGQ